MSHEDLPLLKVCLHSRWPMRALDLPVANYAFRSDSDFLKRSVQLIGMEWLQSQAADSASCSEQSFGFAKVASKEFDPAARCLVTSWAKGFEG